MLPADANHALVSASRFIAQYLIAVPVILTLWAVIARRRVRTDIIEAVVAGVLTIAFVKIGAAFYAHARPFVLYHRTPFVPHAPDNAFPSDHLSACGLAAGYLWSRNRTYALVTIACAALIGAARVLTGLHWPIDIAAGFVFGLAGAGAAYLLLRPRRGLRSGV